MKRELADNLEMDEAAPALHAADRLESLSGRAYTHLLETICSAVIPPGEFIARRAIARKLGISLAPVNEAIMRLDAEGFVETLPRRGTRVKLPSLEDIRGELYIREALEAEAARLYCGAPITAARDGLEAAVRALDNPSLTRIQLIHADLDIHQSLVGLANNRVLAAHFRHVVTKHVFLGSQELLMNIGGWRPADHDKIVSSHMQMIADLCQANPLQADAIIRNHIRSARAALF
jgi:DNA-binding GntR family transcriptional regulator